MNCGRPFFTPCSNCGTSLPAAARFCFNCGQAVEAELVQSKEGGKVSSSRTPVPRFASQNPAIIPRSAQSERRVLTVLFCDVKDSTAAAEMLDPEEWTELIQQIFEQLISAVHQFGGNVARLMGDAILAFFGAPIAHEDDPQRAVLAGLEIVEKMSVLQENVLIPRGLNLNVRVGINTGLAVVGEVGNSLRTEYTAMGDAVNLAARMEQTAMPGTVQISQDTYQLVAHLFEVEALGAIEVKGRMNSISAYRVIGHKDQNEKQHRSGSWSTTLVGRQNEMKALNQALQDLLGGRGQIVCITGEAGIGKSRLLAEMRLLWEDNAARTQHNSLDVLNWIECRSPSFSNNSPYATFRTFIRTFCGINDQDPVQIVEQKISKKCLEPGIVGEERKRILQSFQILLGSHGRIGMVSQPFRRGFQKRFVRLDAIRLEGNFSGWTCSSNF